MKKWQVIPGIMLALVVSVLAPLTAMAQSSEETTAAARPALKGALAIVAPRAVAVDREMSLGVFLRENQEPVEGAGVWALTKDSAEALRTESETLKGKAVNGEEPDYEALLGGRGSFLGKTGGNGKLLHTFKEAGNYVLAAAKKGYFPDFSPLVVGGGGGNKLDALVIKAPRVSPPGDPVTIAVGERTGGEPVKDAGVWALTREQAEELKGKIGEIRTADDDSSVDAEALLNGRGIFLGRTHGNGELKYTFEKEGIYVLVAFKKGYLPGLSGIAIKNAPKALAIKAPQTSPVGESVTIGVSERGNGEAVKDAGVWALTPAQSEELKSQLTGINQGDNATGIADAESILNGRGIFLGRTNGNGELKYTFNTAGRYVLIAAKKGYIPGYTGIGIIAPRPALKPSSNTTATIRPNVKPEIAPKANIKPGVPPKTIERPNPGNIQGNKSDTIKPNGQTPKN